MQRSKQFVPAFWGPHEVRRRTPARRVIDASSRSWQTLRPRYACAGAPSARAYGTSPRADRAVVVFQGEAPAPV